MSIKTQNYINGRLSLRAPQAESLPHRKWRRKIVM